MKYSFNTWAYSNFPCWVPSYPLKETIERLARISYDALEVGCAQPHAQPYYLDTAKRKKVKKWLADSGIEVSSMLPQQGGWSGNIASACKEEREQTIKYWKDYLDLGLEWDCRTLLSVCGWYIYGTRRKEAWKYAVESITKVAEYAKDKVAMLCLEPTAADSNLVEGCDDAISMMEDINMDNVKLMSDTAHVVYRNEVPSDYVYTMRKDLKHVHVTDYDPKEPGTTRCDFLPIMQALKDIEFNGYITIESGFASRSSHADSIARIALEHLKAIEKKMIIGDCFIQE